MVVDGPVADRIVTERGESKRLAVFPRFFSTFPQLIVPIKVFL
jgi:hypothetical protein